MSYKDVFEYDNFVKYFDQRLAPYGASRGLRNRLATTLKIRPTYVSKFLSGKTPLSLEYVPTINQILEHTEEESKFLMLLVLYNQAGTKQLETHFKKEIDLMLEKRRVDADWVKKQEILEEELQAEFVSHWYFAVIHVLTRIPQFQSVEAIASRLGLSLSTVTSALEFLVRAGLVERVGTRFKMTEKRLHLKKNSKWISQYHTHIRHLAIRSYTEPKPEDLHYSIAMSISNADKNRIQKIVQEAVAKIEPVIEKSDDQDACVLAIDFFSV